MIRLSALSRLSFRKFVVFALFLLSTFFSAVFAQIHPLGFLYPNFNGGYAIDIANHHAYVTGYEGGTTVLDISNPQQPVIETVLAPIIVDDHYGYSYTYLASNRYSLKIYDLIEPDFPQLVSTTTLPFFENLAVSGDWMIIYGGDSVSVFDIANKAQPFIAARIAGFPSQVVCNGNVIVLVGANVDTIDVYSTASSQPQHLSTLTNHYGFSSLVISDQYLFFVSYDSLNCYNLGYNPPRLITKVQATPECSFSQLWTHNNRLFALTNNYITRFSIDTVHNRLLYGLTYMLPFRARDLAWDGDIICSVGDGGYGHDGMWSMRETQGSTVGRFCQPGVTQKAVMHNGYCYIPDREGGLLITQIAADGVSHLVTQFNPGASLGATSISFVGDTAYVPSYYGGFYALDVSQPVTPRIIGEISADSLADSLRGYGENTGLFIQGHYAFIVTWWTGDESYETMEIVDISDPAHMRILKRDLPGANCIMADDSYFYISNVDTSFQIVSYANIDSPRVVGSYQTPNGGYASCMTVNGNLAYLVERFDEDPSGMRILDISDPSAPRSIGFVNGLVANQMQIVNNYLITNSWNGAIQIRDITFPNVPILRGEVPSGPSSQWSTWTVSGTRILVSYGNAFGVYDAHTVLPVATDDQNFLPDAFTLTNYPNPFNARTIVRYSLPQAGNVRIDLFNTIGRKVATLVNGRQMAGEYRLPIDATRLSSGEYFIRMTVGKNTLQHRKVTLLK